MATEMPKESCTAASAIVKLGNLDVRGTAVGPPEDVDRTRVTVLAVGPDHDGAARDRHGYAELVARRGVDGRELIRRRKVDQCRSRGECRLW